MCEKIPSVNWCPVTFPAGAASQALKEMETKPCYHLLETELSLLRQLCWFIVAAEGMGLGILHVFNNLEPYCDHQGQTDTEEFFLVRCFDPWGRLLEGEEPPAQCPGILGGPASPTALGLGQLERPLEWPLTIPQSVRIKKSLNLQEFFQYSWIGPALLTSAAVQPPDEVQIFHPPHPEIHWFWSETSCKLP